MSNPSANATQLPPSNIHVFVDFENVHQLDFSLIGTKSVYFTLLLGAQQQKLDVAVVEMLLSHSRAVELVRLNSSGKNALDFALAYYVGRAVTADPSAYFHIISKDKGFDPLIEHLKTRHIKAARHDDFSTLMSASPKITGAAKVDRDLLKRLVENLSKTKNRPKKHKALKSHVRAFGGKGMTAAAVLDIVENLQTGGHLAFDEKERVIYFL